MSPLALIRPWMAYGLYASRSRGVWDNMDYIVSLAPLGWKEKYNQGSFKEDSLP